jgi:DNA processing protein
LIKQGAKLVEHAKDIIEELNLPQTKLSAETRKQPAIDLTPDEKMILLELSPYPVHIDELIRRLSLPTARVFGLLLQLELKGLVTQSPGKFFARAET